MNMAEVGQYLQRRRMELNLTPKQISDISGVDLATVGRVEKGERFISRAALPSLAAAYKLPLFTLLSMIFND